MRTFQRLLIVGALMISSTKTYALNSQNEVPTVAKVELSSYLGLWFEVRRIENEFQDNNPKNGQGACFNTTAEYGLLPKGKVSVKNTCYRNNNIAEIAKAKARIVKGSHNAKLKVNFTGIPLLEFLHIGDGDYWILALGPLNAEGLYSWVLVGAPKLDYGWILSRTRDLASDEIDKALNIAEAVGYHKGQFKNFQK